jgi:hypothetical protein
VKPLDQIAGVFGYVPEADIDVFYAVAEESGMKVNAIIAKRWAAHLIDVDEERPLTLKADWDEVFGDNLDVVFVLSERV